MCGDFKRQIILLFTLSRYEVKRLLFLLLAPLMHKSDVCICCRLPA